MSKFDFLKTFLLGILVLLICFISAVSYMLSDGFRDYQKYCAGFIPHLNTIKLNTGNYPESLNEISKVKNTFRYKREKCLYTERDNEFELVTGHGFIGIAIYESKRREWFYD